MPRVVNHEARRRELADALLRITADRGLDEVSIREVAAEAGVSIGTVQHYFPTKDDLLLFAFQHIANQIVARVATIDTNGTVSQVLRRFLSQLLPLDEQRAVEGRVYLAFAARAAVVPYLAAVQSQTLAQIRTACADAIRRGQEVGETPASVDPDREAAVVVAVADGLLLHVLTDPEGLPPAVAQAALDAFLGSILDLTGPDQH